MTQRPVPRAAWLPLVAALAVLLSAAPAAATPATADGPATVDGASWSLAPATPDGRTSNRPYLVETLAPGDVLRDQLVVANTGTEPLRLRVYPTDAVAAPNGRFGLLTASQTPQDLGTWLTPARAAVTVPPGGRRMLPVTLRVPADATPGDHLGAVVTSVARPVRRADGTVVLVDSRVAVRVYLRVTGPAAAGFDADDLVTDWDQGAWWDPFDDTVRVSYDVRNTGAVRLAVLQQVTATGLLGLDLGQRSAASVPELLPGAATPVAPEELDLTVPAGPVTVRTTVTATDPVTGEQLAPVVLSTRLVALPWALLTLAAVALAALLLMLALLRRRRT